MSDDQHVGDAVYGDSDGEGPARESVMSNRLTTQFQNFKVQEEQNQQPLQTGHYPIKPTETRISYILDPTLQELAPLYVPQSNKLTHQHQHQQKEETPTQHQQKVETPVDQSQVNAKEHVLYGKVDENNNYLMQNQEQNKKVQEHALTQSLTVGQQIPSIFQQFQPQARFQQPQHRQNYQPQEERVYASHQNQRQHQHYEQHHQAGQKQVQPQKQQEAREQHLHTYHQTESRLIQHHQHPTKHQTQHNQNVHHVQQHKQVQNDADYQERALDVEQLERENLVDHHQEQKREEHVYEEQRQQLKDQDAVKAAQQEIIKESHPIQVDNGLVALSNPVVPNNPIVHSYPLSSNQLAQVNSIPVVLATQQEHKDASHQRPPAVLEQDVHENELHITKQQREKVIKDSITRSPPPRVEQRAGEQPKQCSCEIM